MDIAQIVKDNIEGLVHMSLATSVDGQPWVCEVHFAYDHQLNLYFRSLLSRRHSKEIAGNPKVAGNIVAQFGLGQSPAVGVYFDGTANLVTDTAECAVAYECIAKRLRAGPEILQESATPNGHKFYKITVANWHVFGKFGNDSSGKYTLPWNVGKK